jgi:hypothetical protein
VRARAGSAASSDLCRVVESDEVARDLGVGLGLEADALGLELALDRGVVLDHSVVDQADTAVRAQMRVGVGVRHAAVGGPAGVADAELGVGLVGAGEAGHFLHPSGLFQHREAAVLPQAHPGRVVAAVLKAFQAVDQDTTRALRPDVANDSTHKRLHRSRCPNIVQAPTRRPIGCVFNPPIPVY